MMTNDSLLDLLVSLTEKRDAVECILALTPESHAKQVAVILRELEQTRGELTLVLEHWAVDWVVKFGALRRLL